MNNLKKINKNDIIELTQNKKVLKGLALAGGVNWQKVTYNYKFNGHFTINELKKICPNCKILICKIKPRYYDKNNNAKELKVIEVLNNKTILNNNYMCDFSLNSFYSKSEFEEERKKDDSNWLIIAQKIEDLNTPKDRNDIIYYNYEKISLFNRFKNIKEICKTYYYLKNNFYYSGFYFKNQFGKEQKVEYKQENTNRKYFDKSGYLLAVYQDRLKNKLAIYKAKKRMEEAKKINIDNNIKNIESQIETIKKDLTKQMEIIKDFDTVAEIIKKLDQLKWVLHYFEILKTKYSYKEFSSPESIKNYLEDINNRIKTIKGE